MRVFTIQPKVVWEILQQKGKFQCDKRRICDSSFREAYKWYVSQAKKRIPNWKSERPVWVWTKKPDMRSYRFIKDARKAKQEDYVILELEISPEKILLSDFVLWHYVLNKSYLPFTKKESLGFDKICRNKFFFNDLPKKLQQRVVSSWDRCLLIEPGHLKKFDRYVWGPKADIQGIVEELLLKEVVKATPFKMINTHR